MNNKLKKTIVIVFIVTLSMNLNWNLYWNYQSDISLNNNSNIESPFREEKNEEFIKKTSVYIKIDNLIDSIYTKKWYTNWKKIQIFKNIKKKLYNLKLKIIKTSNSYKKDKIFNIIHYIDKEIDNKIFALSDKSNKWKILLNKTSDINKSNNIIWINHKEIKKVPKNLWEEYVKNFTKYIWIKTNNGKYIHIVAQNKISNEQMLRVKNILIHYLTDLPWSMYWSNKAVIADNMSNNNATLLLLNGSDDGNNSLTLNGQPLYETEIQTEWWEWYINQDYEHRDASYEEILHFVHDYGIWVDWPNSTPGKAPRFQKEIRNAQKNSLTKKIWWLWSYDWIKELKEENSLSQEYLASVIDSYYGLWWAWEESKWGMYGIYIAKSRSEIKDKDPKWYELLDNKFFHSYLTYNARIESSFKWTFSLKFNKLLPYTYHSQYLKDITLLWDNNTNVVVNQLDNNITWNDWKNIVIFSWKYSEYKIVSSYNLITIVEDKVKNRDWKNIIKNIEALKFNDRKIELSK